MAGFFSVDRKEKDCDLSNVENYELTLHADEIAKKVFKTMFKQSLELAARSLEEQEENEDFE